MRASKKDIPHGNPELTRRLLESIPAEIDRIRAQRLAGE
jgi:hypothetical protein